MKNLLEQKICYKTLKNNKINCIDLFNISHNFNIAPEKIKLFIEKNNIRIKNCEAGEFESKKVSSYNIEIYKTLKKYTDNNNKIKCRDIWNLSKKYEFRTLTETIKSSNIGIIYCLFGCFKEKQGLRVRAKIDIKIENKATGIVLDKNTVQILELIKENGSISSAAKIMNISYKQAWGKIKLLETDMNKAFVIKSRGREKGGSILTKEANDLIEKFKILQNEVDEYANSKFTELFYKDRIKNKKE